MTITSEENQAIIGRASINDIEAILSVANTDVDEVLHVVKDEADAIFTWDYSLTRPALRRLYEKAKVGQWNATTDLPWDTEVDQEKIVIANAEAGLTMADFDVTGTPFASWDEKQWIQLGIESQNWMLSQFMHGEQGALICTAKIVETVPWIDAKYYAATQVLSLIHI